jgi:hypothetical protein
LNEPQDPAGAQVQSTPAFAVSFVTVAEIVAVALAARVAGGAVVREMETALDATVMVATAVAVWLFADVAVIVTVPPAEGAV